MIQFKIKDPKTAFLTKLLMSKEKSDPVNKAILIPGSSLHFSSHG